MSLRAATTAEEARFQYCNYGYDKSKYTSREDCLARYNPSPAVYTKPIERKPIDDLPIGGGAAGGWNIPKLPEIKNKQVEPTKKNNLPMIIGVVVIGAILYFFYKKK